jgi:hypothetical protein
VLSTAAKYNIMSNPIVICNLCTGQFDVYMDASDASAQMGVHPSTLRRWIRDGIAFKNTIMVGRGEIHKSNRGGKRS